MFTKRIFTSALCCTGLLLLCAWMSSCDGGGSGNKSSSKTPATNAPASTTPTNTVPATNPYHRPKPYSGPPPNVGSNDINKVICIGDSITEGTCAPAGAPYPSRLASLCGKTVVNAGVCGEKSAATATRAPGLLAAEQPGYMCLLIGANDATIQNNPNPSLVGNNVRTIIRAAKAQQTVPIVGTLLPMYRDHSIYNNNASRISDVIRQVVREEGAILVDLQGEFWTDDSLIQNDGIHPTSMGTQIIAAAFNDRI